MRLSRTDRSKNLENTASWEGSVEGFRKQLDDRVRLGLPESRFLLVENVPPLVCADDEGFGGSDTSI